VVTEDQVRQQLQVTRQALQQGDPRQSEQALEQLDAMVTPAQNPDLQQAIDNARQALARNDTVSAAAALQQVSDADLNPQVNRGRHG
jgi:outer membrane PBP1 activator LpoA protein